MAGLKQRHEEFRRPRDDRAVIPDDDWALNQLGITRHRLDKLIGAGVGEPEFAVPGLGRAHQRAGIMDMGIGAPRIRSRG